MGSFRLTDKVAHGVARFNRRRKYQRFARLIRPSSRTKILDVGFSESEYSDTTNFLEKTYPFPNNLTALGIDRPVEFKKRYPKVKAIQYDGRKFPFADKEFDVCWSNAVLEHVGNFAQQVDFLREIHRTSKIAFITTPNKNFPVEVHTRTPLLHFLPKKIFDRYLAFVGKQWATGDYMNLLSKKDLRTLLRLAGIEDHRIIGNRLLLWTLDFVIIFR